MSFGFLGLLVCAAACAQAPNPADVARTSELVKEGALPRAELDRAQAIAADEADEAVLRRTLYGNIAIEDLTEEQGEQMLAAARRRFERRQARVDGAKKQVEAGGLPRLALTPYLEELDRARRELDTAASRARLLAELAEIVRTELAVMEEPSEPILDLPLYERYRGDGVFPEPAMKSIVLAFERQFSKPLPVSARGATALHRALGFDHRGRVDVALDPDQPEGVWLRRLLESLRIPYYAFRTALAGRSTGPHIHIGPPSEPIRRGG